MYKIGFLNFIILAKIYKKEVILSICIFPGTFNPIHQAHIRIAEFALSYYGFEKIIFIPSYIPPHKNVVQDLVMHRYNMVKIAIADNPKFEISDIEYLSEGKSYSLITVQKILEQYRINGKLNFIIGTDAFDKIESWYKAEELKNLVHFIVFPRGVVINKKDGFDYEMAPLAFFDISSTDVRNNHDNDTISKVKDYIEENGLYRD